MTRTALILGANGRFGRHCLTAFQAAGWNVRRFDRKTDDLTQVAQGVDVIVNGLNPAYTDWAKDVPTWTEKVIAAAKASGATVLVAGNVYVFGPQTPAPWGPGAPHAATNPMGRIRASMEAAYRDAGVRTIILRSGDYIDTEASGNWFDRIMVAQLAKGRFVCPGNPDVARAWAFLPDKARLAADLAERRASLPRFADIAYPGYTLTGRQMAEALSEVTGRRVKLSRFPWWQLRLAAPFWPLGRRLLEMRYLWNTPHWLDAGPHGDLLSGHSPTPLPEALRAAI